MYSLNNKRRPTSLYCKVLIFLVFFTSCAHTPQLPDESTIEELSNFELTPKTRAEKWVVYGQMIQSTNPEIYCQGHQGLYQQRFFLRALNRAEVLLCANKTAEEFNQHIDDIVKQTPVWAKKKVLETLIGSGQLSIENQIILGLEYRDYIEVREERVDHLLLLKSLAEQAGEAKLLEQVRDQLLIDAPRFNEDIDDENIFAIARDFERARQFERARELYLQIFENEKLDFSSRLQAKSRVATSYRLERKMERSHQITQEIADFVNHSYRENSDDPDIQNEWFNRQESAIRSLWTRNETKTAREQASKFIEDHKEGLTTDQEAKIWWLKGLMSKELAQKKETLQKLRHAFHLQVTQRDLRENILWSYFWELLEQNNTTQAFELAQNINPHHYNDSTLARVYFWTALYKIQQGKEEAYRYFRLAFERQPLGYYGLLAQIALGADIPKLPPKIPRGTTVNELEWLLQFNLNELAKEYFRDLISKASLSEGLHLLHYGHRVRDYRQTFSHYFRFVDQGRDYQRNRYLTALYPLAWSHEINYAAEMFNIPQTLILSLIRQESAFDHQARSWADAFGLMQLIPERAEQVARRYGIEYSHYTDLFDPKINVIMGSALLNELMEKYDFPFFLAAYNAGERPLNHWLATRAHDNPFVFIENIPYRETRGYIQHIVRNLIIYNTLINEDFSDLDQFLSRLKKSKDD